MEPEISQIDNGPQTTAEQTQKTVDRSPKSVSITILAMALFVLASLSVVAFLYYQNQQLKKMLAGYQTPVATPTPSPVSKNLGLPANTFEFCGLSRPKIQFSINPPADWNIKEGSSSENYQEYRIAKGDEFITITCGIGFGGGGCVGDDTTLKIGNQNVRSCLTTDPNTQKVSLNLSYLDYGENSFSFGGLVNTKQTFTQVLSTFKFLGASPTPSSSQSPSSPLPQY